MFLSRSMQGKSTGEMVSAYTRRRKTLTWNIQIWSSVCNVFAFCVKIFYCMCILYTLQLRIFYHSQIACKIMQNILLTWVYLFIPRQKFLLRVYCKNSCQAVVIKQMIFHSLLITHYYLVNLDLFVISGNTSYLFAGGIYSLADPVSVY